MKLLEYTQDDKVFENVPKISKLWLKHEKINAIVKPKGNKAVWQLSYTTKFYGLPVMYYDITYTTPSKDVIPPEIY